MSFELFISLRYLKAGRKQVFVSIITFISMVGIFLGVAALIVVLAVMNGFETDLRDKILGINSHVVLTEYSGTMRNYQKIMKDCARVDGVVAVTPFIYGQAMLKNGESVSGVVLKGLTVEAGAFKVINIGRMKEGSADYLSEKHRVNLRLDSSLAGLPGIIVGKELAKNLGIFLFDVVNLISPMGVPTPLGMVPRMKKFLVVGVFDSGFYEYDSTLACLALKDCQEFLNMDDNVTGIEIRVNDIYKADIIAKVMERKLGYPYLARNWMEMNKNLFSALKLEKRVMFIILSLIVLVAAFNIISILIMVVMGKNREIAILKSMGATSKSIMKIFILQGLIIGALGTFFGCLGGLSIALNIKKLSHVIENLFKFKILSPDVYYLSELPSRVNYVDVSIIVVGTMLICFLSTIYPSWRASRLDPAEALRYE
ncbi:MAG: ABC transporter permease [Syntrophaceae bacterium CG2_30_49_12]|nr:MAG: ABC transporter permease [Syntrophaceae bacterium CG2_30_49_12]PIP05549.1 MAG: lipoprotein-releasing system transmembrane subunit LolC [Syntrophobacterales bacterium CG23_combo_of_CG06-09_8_20_14_all_48_27]PJA50507.1 MAG: lipoprotein-releasing system transmembrane subunit LolC [Syntrophobacterales bacterium CG_4_9_14_3_um_filter_49_8]PJC73422.1 MAG: lipoprotein-releasing system transmembrane subunit LolC [Syntrophobacterales bacterium CG_4_8_14_3_um_filter_49_14]